MSFGWIKGFDTFTVSAKAAIYSFDFKKVLIMRYPKRCGLPGGHLELGETPDVAVARELMEELMIEIPNLKRTDFFLRNDHPGTSVILGYTGIAPKNLEVNATHPNEEYGEWVSRDEVPGLDMNDGYKKLILDNWPNP